MPEIQGKKTPMDWSMFVARRRLQLTSWINHHRFTTYEDIVQWCKTHSVQPPDETTIDSYLPKAVNPSQKTKLATEDSDASHEIEVDRMTDNINRQLREVAEQQQKELPINTTQKRKRRKSLNDETQKG